MNGKIRLGPAMPIRTLDSKEECHNCGSCPRKQRQHEYTASIERADRVLRDAKELEAKAAANKAKLETTKAEIEDLGKRIHALEERKALEEIVVLGDVTPRREVKAKQTGELRIIEAPKRQPSMVLLE